MNIDLPFSLMKKTVLRVQINCIKCKTAILKAVAKLEGVNEITVDGDKGTLTVIGEVDPVLVAKQLRKSGKTAHIISVGPPKKECSPATKQPLPTCCKRCELVAVGVFPPYEGRICSIL